MVAPPIGGGLLAASVAPTHPLRNGMLGGAALLALAWTTYAVLRAALGKVNVGEYGSWELYWLTSLFALIAFGIIGAVLGSTGLPHVALRGLPHAARAIRDSARAPVLPS